MAKIAITGCGAMGSVYAALLADAGHEVCAVDPWEDHVRAMRDNGLRAEGASGDRTVRLRATTDAAEVGDVDLVIIATKHDGVRAAAEAMRPNLGSETPVLSIQNGLGGPDMAAEVLGRERVVIGVVGGFGASMRAPGHVHHNGMEFVRIGEMEGGQSERIGRIAEIWRSAGFSVETFEDIHRMVWEKLICNCAYSGPCTLTGLTMGQVLDDADASAVSQGCAIEAWQVAEAKGIALGIEDPVAYVRDFGAKIRDARPSMALDHMARRRTEIDAINGAIPREAAAFGLTVPTNTFVTRLVRASESVF